MLRLTCRLQVEVTPNEYIYLGSNTLRRFYCAFMDTRRYVSWARSIGGLMKGDTLWWLLGGVALGYFAVPYIRMMIAKLVSG